MPNTSEEEKHLGGLMILDLVDQKGMYCTRMFAELGADVYVIERPGGSPLRNIGPFFTDIPDPERSLYWWYYNSSKKSITLNLETRGMKPPLFTTGWPALKTATVDGLNSRINTMVVAHSLHCSITATVWTR